MDKSVAGQQELEALYSATRNAKLGAEQHERLRGLAQNLLAILQQAAQDSKASEIVAKNPDGSRTSASPAKNEE